MSLTEKNEPPLTVGEKDGNHDPIQSVVLGILEGSMMPVFVGLTRFHQQVRRPRFLLILTAVACLLANTTAQTEPSKPNFVLILVDDLGWSDVGCYGNRFIETPSIDRLAAEGVRFTDFYAAGPVCSPTRCALQSGQNQARIGITAHIPGHWRPFERVITPQTTMALPLETVTIAEALAKAGYATGYVGKWHLGNDPVFWPEQQGYDFSAVLSGPHLPGRFRVVNRQDLKPKADQYRTDFEGELVSRFIHEHRDKPFFVMVSPYAVHIPLGAMSIKVDKYRKKAAVGHRLPHVVYAAMMEHIDDMVGHIVGTLEKEGLTNRTMIVFTSDNGGLYRRYDYQPGVDDDVTSNAPLRGEKGTLYEGGIRVPLIVKYPPLTQPAARCSEPTISYDLFPTFVELAGGKLPSNQAIDGLSLVPLLHSPGAKLERDSIHFHYPHYHHSRPASCLRQRNWKLIEFLDGTGDSELYNLALDIGETVNLASQNPERLAAMQEALEEWRQQVLARMPLSNPSYQPGRAGEWWSRRAGKPVKSDQRKPFPPTELDQPME